MRILHISYLVTAVMWTLAFNNFKHNELYLSINVFSITILIVDTR